jgi:hypothetical protein
MSHIKVCIHFIQNLMLNSNSKSYISKKKFKRPKTAGPKFWPALKMCVNFLD